MVHNIGKLEVFLQEVTVVLGSNATKKCVAVVMECREYQDLGKVSGLYTIVAGASGLDGRVNSLTTRIQNRIGVTTLRNRTMIGSSFRSSFSLAATSMEYARKTDLMSAAWTEIYYENVSSQAVSHLSAQTRQRKYDPRVQITDACDHVHNYKTHLGFPHNLAPGADPRNEDEFLTLRLLVVRISDTCIGEGGLSGI